MFFGMPVLWRYLIGQFLKVFVFSTIALVLCLLTLRLEEIAHFASLDTTGGYILAFVLYQIPYILPIALPLSCLISSMILVGRLSSTHEISALRSLGYSLTKIFQPLLMVALLISALNFYITSEVATQTHLQTTLLKAELRSINPLLLLHNKHLLRVKGIFYDALGPTKMGELASDVVIALPGKKGGRMNLFVAKKLEALDSDFFGEKITFITAPSVDANNNDISFGSKMLVENIDKTNSKIEDFADTLQKKAWSINDDYLSFKFLLLRKMDLSPEDIKLHNRVISEMARRLSLGIAPLTFTLLGFAFGLSISRKESKKGLIWVTLLAALYLITFFLAKGMSHKIEATVALYFVPHLILIIASLVQLRQISHGKES